MAEGGTYKIFKSRNRISSDSDTSKTQKINDVSTVGALPDFNAKKSSKNHRKSIKTLDKSNLKPQSTSRRRSKRLNPDFDAEETHNVEQEPQKKTKHDKSVLQIKNTNSHIAAAKKQAINISFVRENLRANNKALAVALEHAKLEIKALKNEKIQFQTTIQELQSQLSRFQEDAKSFEARFEKALQQCFANKFEDVLSDFSSFQDLLRRKYLKNAGDETSLALSLNSALNENLLCIGEEQESLKTMSGKEISCSSVNNTNETNLEPTTEILRNLDPNISIMFDKDDTIKNIENEVDDRRSTTKRGRRSNLWH